MLLHACLVEQLGCRMLYPSNAVALPGRGAPACGILPAAPAAGPLVGAPFPGAMGQGGGCPACTACHGASGS